MCGKKVKIAHNYSGLLQLTDCRYGSVKGSTKQGCRAIETSVIHLYTFLKKRGDSRRTTQVTYQHKSVVKGGCIHSSHIYEDLLQPGATT